MPVLENYRLRFDVEGAEKAERAFRRTGQAVQESLQRATDPTASARNLHQLERSLDRSERELGQLRTALRPIPQGMMALDRGARAAQAGMMALSGTVPGLAAVSGVFFGPVGLIAGVAALGAGVASRIPRAVAELSSMADTAERIGISAEQFQELRGAMLLMTEDATALTPALQRLQEVVGQAAGGFGEGATAFRDLGLEARTAEGEVKSLEELLPEIADRMQAATSQAERLAIAQRLFGEQGRAFVRVLEQGSGGLDMLADKAREAGIVLEEDLVEQAREADAQLKLANEQISTASDRLLVALAPSLAAGANAFADFVGWVTDATAELGRFDDALEVLAGDGAVTESVTASTEKMIAELEARLDSGIGSERYRQGLRDLIAMRREQLAFMQLSVMPDAPPVTLPAGTGGGVPIPPPRAAAPPRPGSTRPVRRSVVASTASGSTLSSGSSEAVLRWEENMNRFRQTGEDTAFAIDGAFVDAFDSVGRGLNLLGVESDSAFGRMVNGAVESMRVTNQLLQTVQSLGIAVNSASGGGVGELFSGLLNGGLSLLSASAPGTAASIGAATGATTGNFGGAAALSSGASAASSLGLFGFAGGGEFMVGGASGVDRQVVQFLATPGERVRIEPPGEMRPARGTGGGSPVNVSVKVENRAPGVTVQPQERRTADGGVEIALLVRQVKEDLANDVRERRGEFSHALRDEFASRGGG